jgi:hypothetical protein
VPCSQERSEEVDIKRWRQCEKLGESGLTSNWMELESAKDEKVAAAVSAFIVKRDGQPRPRNGQEGMVRIRSGLEGAKRT